MYFKVSFIFLITVSLTGCASLIVAGICTASDKPKAIPEKVYEAKLSYDVSGKLFTESVEYTCKPDYLACYGGKWKYQYADLSFYDGFVIQVDHDRKIEISRPQCGFSSTLGSEFESLEKHSGNITAKIGIKEDMYILYLSELFQDSADTITGVNIISYSAREKK